MLNALPLVFVLQAAGAQLIWRLTTAYGARAKYG